MLIRVLFITLLFFVLPNTKAQAIVLPPAPDSVVAPSLATGSFSVYWSMSSDNSSMIMSAGNTKGVLSISANPVCPGGCDVVNEFVLEQSTNNGAYVAIYQGTLKSKYISASVGTYRFRVKAREQGSFLSSYSNYTYSNITTVQNSTTPPDNGGVDELPNEGITLATAILEGGATVSGGQASYQVPIQIAPGRNGVQPNVSLNYSSSGGNGLVGVGWSLSATSSISRCAATYAQDGFTKNVTYSATKDRLCLNGQRLMAVSGVYGRSATIYRTELDSFVRVEQFGNINDNYTHFEATYSNGTVAYFGSDSQSRNQHTGAAGIMNWNISLQHDDTENNFIHFEYDNFGEGEQLISNIYYTGNGASSSYKGDRRVNFSYVSRTDHSMRYTAGGKSEQTKKLSGITTYVGSNKIRKYSLNISASSASKRSILKSISLCGYSNNVASCAPATTFQWSDRAAKIILEPLGINGQHAYPNISNIDNAVPRGDRNGDGVRDWSGLYVNAEGEFSDSNDLDLNPCLQNTFTRRLDCVEGDFNQDGLTDDWEKVGNVLHLNITKGSNINTGIQLITSNKYGLSPSRIVNIADYNGDSWPDLMIFHDYVGSQNKPKLKLYLHSGNTSSPYSSPVTVFQYSTIVKSNRYSLSTDIQFVGDITGDGLPDLVKVETGAGYRIPYAQPIPKVLYIAQTTGTFSTSSLNFGISTNPLLPKFTYFMDVNNDGLTDWLGWDNRKVLIARINKGGGVFGSEQTLTGDSKAIVSRFDYISHTTGEPDVRTVPKYEAAFKFHDIDGDGKTELLMPGNRALEGCTLVSTAFPSSSQSYKCGDQLYGTFYSQRNRDSITSINSSIADQSIYQFDALSFKTEADGSIRVSKQTTNLYGHAYQSIIVDAFGNGLPTLVFNHRLQPGSMFSGNASGTPFSGYESSYGVYINRSFGAGTGQTNNDYIPTDMLEKATNGIGLTSKWEYKPLSTGTASALQSTMYDVDHSYNGEGYLHFSSSMYVVKNFIQSNALGGENKTQYAYKGAMYNTQGRGFMGFRSILEYSPLKDVITHTDFMQKFPYQGKTQYQASFKGGNYPSNIETLDNYNSNRYVSYTENKWLRNDAHKSANGVSLEHCEYDNEMKRNYCVTTKGTNAVQHVYLSTSESTSRDINSFLKIQSTSLTQSNINACGNIGTTTREQSDDWGIYKQTSVNNTDNASCDDYGIWWPHKVTSKTVTKHAVVRKQADDALSLYGGSESGLDKSVTLSSAYRYDHDKIRKPTQTTVSALTDSTANPSVTQVTFNNYGLPSETRVVAKVKGVNVTRKVSRVKYSKNGINEATSGDGYFPWEILNALSHTVRIQTEPAIGQPTKVSQQLSGSNYADVDSTFDALGRPLTTSAENSPTMHLRYSLATTATDSLAPSHSVTKVTSYQAGSPTTRVYQDIIGRELRTATEGFSGDWITTDKRYDLQGNTTFESMPKTENGTLYGVTYLGFDILGRPATKETQQDCGLLRTTYNHSGLNTTITANDTCSGGKTISMSRSYNSLKQLVETVDGNNGITRYAYNSSGLPIVIRDASNTDAGTIIAKYNDLGRKVKVNDPNQGVSTFSYNGFGEVEKEIQNANKSSKTEINTTVDLLGRIKVRTATGESTQRYTYDVGNYALGKLYQETGNGVTRTYTYTNYGQLKDTQVALDGRNYKIQNIYNNTYGRPSGLIYPNNLQLSYEYNDNGYLTKVKNAASNLIYREVTAQDNFGQITAATLGNGVRQTAKYSNKTGQVLSLGYSKNNDNVFGVTYGTTSNSSDGYDGFGNMIKSVTVRGSIFNATVATETYAYDNLQRLKSNSIQGIQSVSYTYDAVGNLTSKSDYANSYNYLSHLSGYSGGGSNAVKRVRKNNTWYGFSYDNRGNLIKGDGLAQALYNAMDKPTLINKNGSVSQFTYGPNGMRHKQSKTVAGKNTTTYYVDALYEEEISGLTTQWRAYIGDIAIVSGKSTGGTTVRYTHKDRLGSTLAFTNEQGQVVAQRLFDPFGKPRNIDGRVLSVPRFTDIAQSTTARGFTDHEHLNEAELIHMNGRVYDYNLGRFLSVDPFIQADGNSQGINPYSYIMNNPLSGTDPTGYLIEIKICGGEGTTCDIPEGPESRPGGSEGEGSPNPSGNNPQGGKGNGAQRAIPSQAKQYGNVSDILSQPSITKGNNSPNSGNITNHTHITGTISPIQGNPINGLFKSLARGLTGGIFYGDISSIPGLNAGPVDNADIEAYEAQAGFGQYAMMMLPGNASRAAVKSIRGAISPIYSELKGLNRGFQAHHILPQYLGKMLGYTTSQMTSHPATLVTQFTHTGKVNPNALHKAISKYLPPMVGGRKANYSPGQIRTGLEKSYSDIGRPELFNSIQHLIK